MDKLVYLNNQEIRCLYELLWTNPCNDGCIYEEMQEQEIDCSGCEYTCNGGCIYEEMQEQKIDCSRCEYTKVSNQLIDKLEKIKTETIE